MSQTLQSRTRSTGTYVAIALFLTVYLGVLGLVFAPKDMFSVQSASTLAAND
jgi:hypothetical protein